MKWYLNLKGSVNFEDLGLDKIILLKCSVKRCEVVDRFHRDECSSSFVFYAHSNEHLSSIEGEKFRD